MAFVYREEKLKKIRPNTALGPGEYIPQSKPKTVKNNNGRAPFESGVKKFKSPYGELNAIRNATPGPGKYYVDDFKLKASKIENLASIKRSNYEDSENNNNIKSSFNIVQPKEKLGFDVKEQRFKYSGNYNPGPGEYFQNKKSKNIEGEKSRARSALFLNNDYAPKKTGVLVPSIPYKDNGFEIGENNSLIKLENPNEEGKKNKGKLGPGSYDIDNPQSWLKSGTSWSKMKVERDINVSNQVSSKDITRPESALDLNINIVPVYNPDMINSNIKSKKRVKTAHHIPIYYKMMKYSAEERKQNNLKLLNSKKSYEVPGPGYYLDIQKNSGFYRESQPFPEFKQFFLSNNERFPELKENEFLGPATYFQNNHYFNSAFSSGRIQKNADKNKIKKTPFSTREKRFKYSKNSSKVDSGKTPGPGSYDPKIIKSTSQNKFNNTTNTFNFRAKRFGTTGSDIKWKMSTPGPGSYINPYSATGTSNTLLVNGLYIDIRKGKEILRPKSKETKPLENNLKNAKKTNNSPGVGLYNPDIITSISYNNRKKVKANSNPNVAFSSRIKIEENKKDYKSNVGPGLYYNDKPVKQTQISPPFHDSEVKFKNKQEMFGIGPGYYEPRSYFDWNKKSYNSTFY